MIDKTLTCRDCGSAFLFTVGEQEFYASKGFTHEPTRCRDCRSKRRGADGGYGGGGTYSTGYSGSSSYSTSGSRREMFSATCSNCGKEARVPFQPRSDKPVYCSDCFESHRSAPGAGQRGGRTNGGSRW
ncbi:MAG: zinc-ribbon domain containing protein [Dehalococcoidia bacterium]